MAESNGKQALTELEVEDLRRRISGALEYEDGLVKLEALRLEALLDENDDLRSEVAYFAGGYCECGRPAEFCRLCADGGF